MNLLFRTAFRSRNPGTICPAYAPQPKLLTIRKSLDALTRDHIKIPRRDHIHHLSHQNRDETSRCLAVPSRVGLQELWTTGSIQEPMFEMSDRGSEERQTGSCTEKEQSHGTCRKCDAKVGHKTQKLPDAQFSLHLPKKPRWSEDWQTTLPSSADPWPTSRIVNRADWIW